MGWNEPGDKDPWGKRKSSDTPPDLDQVMKNLGKKFSKVIGSKSVSGGHNGGSASLGLGLIFVVVFAIWLLSGIFIVGPAEEAVVLRFGKYKETVGPGPHWIPRFIDSKNVMNVQRVSNFSYTASMLNKDENIISVSIAIQYRVGNPRDYLFNVVNPQESLQQATASVLRSVIGHTTLDEAMTTGREKVRAEVTKQLDKVLAIYKTGIAVTDVAMQPARAPEAVKEAFDDAIKAQEDEQRFINKAQGYAATVIPAAEGQAKRVVQDATAYRQQVMLIAEGDTSKFLALLPQYQRFPEVTRERIYLDTVQSVLEHTTKILVDVKQGGNVFFMPLDKLFNQHVKVPLKPSTIVEEPSPSTVQTDTSTTRPLRYSHTRISQRDISLRGRQS